MSTSTRHRIADGNPQAASVDATSAAPGRRRKVQPKKSKPLGVRFSPAILGVFTLVVAGIGAVTAGGIPGLPAQYGTVASSYAGGVHSGTTDGTDISRSADRETTQRQVQAQAEQVQRALAEYNASTFQKATDRTQQVLNQWVLPTTGYVLTARFGDRGSHWSSGFHTGLDFAVPVGTKLVAVAAGTVEDTAYSGAYGNRTIIALDNGQDVWYCHQSKILVTVGQKVTPGELIGYSGATGNVTGPHLHLEVHPHGGKEGTAIDPFTTLVSHGVTP